MKYKDYQPTGFDPKGLGLDDRQDWIVAPVIQTRDSGPLDRSNFAAALDILGGESVVVEVHRFGHWGPEWFEIILVHETLEAVVDSIAANLENYPILDEMDFSERESDEADEVWKNCYDEKERIEYIRKNRSQFEFHNMADIMSVVRGKYFNGYASELIS